jgi:NTP pyrophosphatase (non-canonical NTP hydrolase)
MNDRNSVPLGWEGFEDLQEQAGRYIRRTWPGEGTTEQALGLAEEAGEVCRAVLKRIHGTRGTTEQWTAEIRKEAGDVVLVLLGLASYEGFSLAQAVVDRWAETEHRDPNHDPIA